MCPRSNRLFSFCVAEWEYRMGFPIGGCGIPPRRHPWGVLLPIRGIPSPRHRTGRRCWRNPIYRRLNDSFGDGRCALFVRNAHTVQHYVQLRVPGIVSRSQSTQSDRVTRYPIGGQQDFKMNPPCGKVPSAVLEPVAIPLRCCCRPNVFISQIANSDT